MQATVLREDGRTVAELAWVIAGPHQRHGYASEAAAAMAGWLRERGASALFAHVHPDHRASIRVAEGLGFEATDIVVDGEIRWATG